MGAADSDEANENGMSLVRRAHSRSHSARSDSLIRRESNEIRRVTTDCRL